MSRATEAAGLPRVQHDLSPERDRPDALLIYAFPGCLPRLLVVEADHLRHLSCQVTVKVPPLDDDVRLVDGEHGVAGLQRLTEQVAVAEDRNQRWRSLAKRAHG